METITTILGAFVVFMTILIVSGCGDENITTANRLRFDRKYEEACIHGRTYIINLETSQMKPVYIRMPDMSVRIKPCFRRY